MPWLVSYQAWWECRFNTYFHLKNANIFTFIFIRNLSWRIWAEDLSGIWIWRNLRGGHATSLILRVTWVPGDRCSPPSSLMPTRGKGSPELWCSWQNHCPISETNRTCLIQLILSYMVTTSFAPSAWDSQVIFHRWLKWSILWPKYFKMATCHTLPIFSPLCFSLYIIQKHLA